MFEHLDKIALHILHSGKFDFYDSTNFFIRKTTGVKFVYKKGAMMETAARKSWRNMERFFAGEKKYVSSGTIRFDRVIKKIMQTSFVITNGIIWVVYFRFVPGCFFIPKPFHILCTKKGNAREYTHHSLLYASLFMRWALKIQLQRFVETEEMTNLPCVHSFVGCFVD